MLTDDPFRRMDEDVCDTEVKVSDGCQDGTSCINHQVRYERRCQRGR